MLDLAQAALDDRAAVQHFVLVLISAAALRWGAGPERATALTLLSVLLGDQIYHAIFGAGVELVTIDVGHAVIDAIAAFAMMSTAVAANRMYTLWIGAFQIIAVYSHIARDMDAGISPLAYAIVSVAPSYFQIVLLAGGLWGHRRRLRRFGKYSSWRTSLPPSWARGRLAWLGA